MNTLPQTLDTVPAPYPLPDGWRWVKLGEVIKDIQNGFACGNRDETGIIQLRMNNVDRFGNIHFADYLRVPKSAVKSEKYVLQQNDVVFNNTNSKELVGKSALFRGYEETVVFSNHFTRLRPQDNLQAPILTFWLISQWQAGVFARLCNSYVGQSSVSWEKLSQLPFPLPPLAEQERIATRLDGLLTKLREAKRLIAEARESFTLRRAALLHKAFTGDLTADWRTAHPQPAPEATSTPDDAPYDVPESWRWVKLGEVCFPITKGATPSQVASKGDIPFLKVYNIVQQKLEFESNPAFIPQSVHTGFLKRSQILPNDVIMNIVGPPLGKVAIIPNTYPEWNINQAIAFFRPKPCLSYQFLYFSLLNPQTLAEVIDKTRGVVGQSNISLEQCRNLSIPLPPLAEQQEIVRRVEAVLSREQAASELLALDEQIGVMEKAVLARAFRGEL